MAAAYKRCSGEVSSAISAAAVVGDPEAVGVVADLAAVVVDSEEAVASAEALVVAVISEEAAQAVAGESKQIHRFSPITEIMFSN